MYCVVYKGVYNEYYSYVKFPNIKLLARHINIRLSSYPRDTVEAVYLTESYDDPLKKKLFFQIEYNMQYFYETYDSRLIEQHRLENLAV